MSEESSSLDSEEYLMKGDVDEMLDKLRRELRRSLVPIDEFKSYQSAIAYNLKEQKETNNEFLDLREEMQVFRHVLRTL